MPIDARRFEFEPAQRADLPMIARWLEAPHVARWMGDPKDALREIAEHIAGATDATAYILRLDGEPIGYIQSYAVHESENHPYADQPAGSVGIDLFLADEKRLGRGIGSSAVAAFSEFLFERGAPHLVIDPHPDNPRAIRAYEKASFTEVDRRTSVYGPAVLMARPAPRLLDEAV